MKIVIDISEKDYKFLTKTYKVTGLSWVADVMKNECVKAVYNGIPYEERKTGRWVLAEMGDTDLYECSLCKTRTTHKSPFCPHCGAKMEDKDNEDSN